MCPNNCSGRGECRVGNSTASVRCECEANWKGPACDVPYCLADCGFPERGSCQNQTCLCQSGWQGGPLNSVMGERSVVGVTSAGLHMRKVKSNLMGAQKRIALFIWTRGNPGSSALIPPTAPPEG